MVKYISWVWGMLLLIVVSAYAQSLPIPKELYGTYAPQGNCRLEPRLTVNPAGTFIESHGTKTGPILVDVCLTCAGGARYNGIERWLFVQTGKISPVLLRFNADEKPGHVIVSKNDPASAPLTSPFVSLLKAASLERCCVATTMSQAKSNVASVPRSQTSATQFTQLISSLMIPASMPANSYYDWMILDKAPYIQWAPLPPVMLTKPTSDGHYFRRNGIAKIGSQPWKVYAAGARTMVMSHNFLNEAAPLGEDALLAALKQAGFTVTAARCTIVPNRNAPKWYRLSQTGRQPAFLWVIPAGANLKHWEAFNLNLTDTLKPLTPAEQKVYTDHCS